MDLLFILLLKDHRHDNPDHFLYNLKQDVTEKKRKNENEKKKKVEIRLRSLHIQGSLSKTGTRRRDRILEQHIVSPY